MPVLPASAATATFIVRVIVDNGSAGSALRSDFQYTIDGGAATNFPTTGVVSIDLDDATPHTAAPVDFTGYTATMTPTCTNVTLTPGTPVGCTITETFIEPTTTTTTTTTEPPIPTTAPDPNRGPVHGSFSDTNKCKSHLEPELQPDGAPAIKVAMSATAAPEPHHGDPITLTDTKAVLTVPAALLQAGVDVDLIHNGDKVPSVATLVITGQNTVEQTHSFVVSQTAVIKVVGGKAQPLVATLPLADTSWTPVNDTSNVFFFQKSLKIVSTIKLVGTAVTVVATFTCTPTAGQPFVGVGAETALVQPTTPTTTGGPAPGDTTPTGGLATPGATELPRTGSNPWPLLVLGAGLLAVGLAAIDGAKRRRRPIHH